MPPDAQIRILWFDQGPLQVSPRGQLFLLPLDLHVEPSDRLVELGLDGQALVSLAASAFAEERLGAVEDLLFPLADLDWVDLEGPRQLGQSPGLLDRLQGDPRLEGRGTSLSCACHDVPRDGTVNSDEFDIPSDPVLGLHFKLTPSRFPLK